MGIVHALGLFHGGDNIPWECFEAITDTDERADELEFQSAANRQFAKIKARYG